LTSPSLPQRKPRIGIVVDVIRATAQVDLLDTVPRFSRMVGNAAEIVA
jgi:hypothetical protein